MRRALLALLLLAGACGSGRQSPDEPAAANTSRAAPAPAPPPGAPPAAPGAGPARALPDDNMVESAVSGLSPAQRRAFDLGYRDCSRGRYAPAGHLEAYRIGCAAAHDGASGRRPEG
jgi:hypothetical protein